MLINSERAAGIMKDIAQTQSFKDFSIYNYIYIDKTEQIYNLLKTRKLLFKDIAFFAGKLGLPEAIAGDSEPHEAILDLLRALDDRNESIVVLIDEYDAELTASINAPELYERFRVAIRALYGAMKGKRCIRFLCVTGVTRLKDVSIFSVGSDIKDLSYHSPVSAITGFDRDEIRKYYADYINFAVSLEKGIPQSGVSEEQREELLERLAAEYDGYSFDDEYQHRVFSTWSVNSFFHEAALRGKVIFGDYWYDNGGIPSILAKYLEKHSISPLKYSEETGSLTLHSRIPNGNSVRLGVPNREVRRSLEKALSLLIFPSADFAADKNEEFFSGASAEEIVALLNSLMNTISYENYQKINEKTVQGLIHAFMIGAGQPVRTEVQSAAGRSDIVLDYRKRRLVLELKYAGTEKECQEKLKEAAEQIRERRYGDLLPAKDEVLQLALVFCGEEGVRQFTHFETVE